MAERSEVNFHLFVLAAEELVKKIRNYALILWRRGDAGALGGSGGGPHADGCAQIVRQRMEDAIDLYFDKAAQRLTGEAAASF